MIQGTHILLCGVLPALFNQFLCARNPDITEVWVPIGAEENILDLLCPSDQSQYAAAACSEVRHEKASFLPGFRNCPFLVVPEPKKLSRVVREESDLGDQHSDGDLVPKAW